MGAPEKATSLGQQKTARHHPKSLDAKVRIRLEPFCFGADYSHPELR
jgi:hypothetical protein